MRSAWLVGALLWALSCVPGAAQVGPMFPGPGMPASAGSAYTGPGDVVSGALFWGGLRAYTGAIAAAGTQKIANVIKTTTSETCDLIVSATGGLGNTANCSGSSNGQAAATFCGANCVVVTLYDQSGNSRDVTQATAAARPAMVFNCIGSLPCMNFNVANTQVLTGTMVAQNQPYTMAAVANNTSFSAGSNYVMGFGTSFVPRIFFTASGTIGGYAGAGPITATATLNATHSFVFVVNNTTSAIVSDGVASTGTAGTTTLTARGTTFGIGSDGANEAPMNGNIMEAGVWPVGFNSTQYGSMCHNQFTYWGTATSC